MKLMAVGVLAGLMAVGQVTMDWKDGARGSDQWLAEGIKLRQQMAMGLLIVASPVIETEGYWATNILFENKNPEGWRFDVEPEAFALDGRPAESPEQVARKVKRGSRIWAAVVGGMAGFSNPREEVTDYHEGRITGPGGSRTTYSGTTRRRDPGATAEGRAMDQAAAGVRRAEGLAGRIEDTALRARTLLPGETAFGWVYFPKKKMDGEAMLVLSIASQGLTVRIPLREWPGR